MGRVLKALLVVGLVAGFGSMSSAEETKLTSDNTKVTFVGTKTKPKAGKHNGGFKTVTGTATWTGTDLTTLKLNVEIDMKSTYTDTDMLTNHLKTADFFDVANNPKSTFESTKVEKSDAAYKVTGKLTLHGMTKEITFPAKIDVKDGSLTLSSDFKINRHDWGISYGKGMVDDDVSLTVAVGKKK
jgi:polyisoprenoid-binding protein YceI